MNLTSSISKNRMPHKNQRFLSKMLRISQDQLLKKMKRIKGVKRVKTNIGNLQKLWQSWKNNHKIYKSKDNSNEEALLCLPSLCLRKLRVLLYKLHLNSIWITFRFCVQTLETSWVSKNINILKTKASLFISTSGTLSKTYN